MTEGHGERPPGLAPAYGDQWQDQAMAEAYPRRLPYPEEAFDQILARLPGRGTSRVLDVGAGTGDVARPVAARGVHVDALEPSAAMIAVGRQRAGGSAEHLRWMHGRAEKADLAGPYAAITAGECLHWLPWPDVFPRFTGALAPGGKLVVLGRLESPQPWASALGELIAAFSTNQDFAPYHPVRVFSNRGWFVAEETLRTAPVRHTQSTDEHVQAMHSRNGFSRTRMTPQAYQAFDAQYRALLQEHGAGETVTSEVRGELTWGTPVANP